MIPTQVVVPVRVDRTSSWKDSESTFAFRQDRPMRWLQRTCFWILRRLRAYSLTSTMTETVVRLDRDKLMPTIYALLKEANHSQFNRIERIVMGHDTFMKLMNEPDLPRGATLNVPQSLLGFPLQIVPWLDGVMVIPRLVDEMNPVIRDMLWRRPGFEFTDEVLHYRGKRP